MARKSRKSHAARQQELAPVELPETTNTPAVEDAPAPQPTVAELVAAEEAEAAESDAAVEEEIVDLRRSIVPPKYKAKYGKKEHCGDELGYAVSEIVRDGKGQIVMEALAALATENGLSLDRWAHLNPGQQSMNLRNVLRGRVKRGEAVVVAGQRFGAPALTAEDLGL